MPRWAVEARRWLGDAEEDMRVAKLLEEAGHYASACFHYQQSGEKAVKAALYALGIEARGHSVTLLLRLLGERAGRDVSGLEEDAKTLDKHYSPPRYPNLHPGINMPAYMLYSRGDAERCRVAAERLMRFVRELLRELGVT